MSDPAVQCILLSVVPLWLKSGLNDPKLEGKIREEVCSEGDYPTSSSSGVHIHRNFKFSVPHGLLYLGEEQRKEWQNIQWGEGKQTDESVFGNQRCMLASIFIPYLTWDIVSFSGLNTLWVWVVVTANPYTASHISMVLITTGKIKQNMTEESTRKGNWSIKEGTSWKRGIVQGPLD